MLSKKLILASVITLQLMTNLIAITPSRADAPSPEFTFLATAKALHGSGLSQTVKQQKLDEATQIYKESNAPIEGREDRVQQAVAQLGIMTSEQAAILRANTDYNVRAKMNNKSDLSEQEATTLMSESAQSVLLNTPGLGFSSCTPAHKAWSIALGIAGGTLLGLGIENQKQHWIEAISGTILCIATITVAFGDGC